MLLVIGNGNVKASGFAFGMSRSGFAKNGEGMEPVSHVDDIRALIEAYDWPEVKEAIKIIGKRRSGQRKTDRADDAERKAQEETEWFEVGDATDMTSAENQALIERFYREKLEWHILNGKIRMRTPKLPTAPKPEADVVGEIRTTEKALIKELQDAKKKPKTDLSMKQTDKFCIYCSGAMAYEPICPGCRLGKIGFKGRFVCMEDMDHEFYVLREGVILPNQGEIPEVN